MTPPKRRSGGRVTPKGTQAGARPSGGTASHAAAANSRYTPPVPRSMKVSPPWVPVVMFALLGLGIVVILLNYIAILLPGATSNWYLVVGLVAILGGIIAATQYH